MVRCAKTKTAIPIDMPFWMKTRVGTENRILDGGADSLGEWQFFGVDRAIQKHWQSLLLRSLQRRCKRDRSVANNLMQQKGAFSMSVKRK